ncbi:hypothetical protein [Bradyrhizobium sp. SZCCHNS3052]|uniref:hypothetical protein n=1 Tax=Bradyrhizobium sp. SZCCHNS3052 TaxID=3057321 RepID=UPI002916626A|nr:hypothetical protein [Bradyrhizobium sp. SZCCHNS3052]
MNSLPIYGPILVLSLLCLGLMLISKWENEQTSAGHPTTKRARSKKDEKAISAPPEAAKALSDWSTLHTRELRYRLSHTQINYIFANKMTSEMSGGDPPSVEKKTPELALREEVALNYSRPNSRKQIERRKLSGKRGMRQHVG